MPASSRDIGPTMNRYPTGMTNAVTRISMVGHEGPNSGSSMPSTVRVNTLSGALCPLVIRTQPSP